MQNKINKGVGMSCDLEADLVTDRDKVGESFDFITPSNILDIKDFPGNKVENDVGRVINRAIEAYYRWLEDL